MSPREPSDAEAFDSGELPDEERSGRDREAARRERASRRAARGSTLAPPQPPAGRSTPGRGQVEGRDGRAARRRIGGGGSGRDGPPRRPGGRPPGPGREPLRRRRLALAVALVLALVVVWIFAGFWSPFAGQGDEPVRVRIPQGAGVQQIADTLDERGVVASGAVFSARVRISGRGAELKPGSYALRTGMGYGAAIAELSEGPARSVINVTVPEGRARGEIAPLVEASGLSGSYERASRRSSRLDPAEFGAKDAESLEGFLFPSTYELRRGATAGELVARQLDAFTREFGRVDLSEARRRRLSPYEVLTIASMVEREAQLDRERPLIASVIYNRIGRGEPLGIDATIRFATKNWERPLTQSQLAVDSPFNTRANAGLPPGPIGNPGLPSIQAAAKPARSNYLFYVVKPNTCGEHAFSRTSSEFDRDSQAYNSERAARGGRSPDDCPQ
ncbi:MAG TPA: endolytic transglycosylase MltG [Thermoleophilaceae bacterium]|nr:endolytic transglycosylase MltG [Thermoleophilaceae bacterium]